MNELFDAAEDAERRAEYATVLLKTGLSEFQGHCDSGPYEPKSGRYPALILEWQYNEGLLVPLIESRDLLPAKGPRTETPCGAASSKRRSELCWRLARHIVAKEAGTTTEYLIKLCRKWDKSRNAEQAGSSLPDNPPGVSTTGEEGGFSGAGEMT